MMMRRMSSSRCHLARGGLCRKLRRARQVLPHTRRQARLRSREKLVIPSMQPLQGMTHWQVATTLEEVCLLSSLLQRMQPRRGVPGGWATSERPGSFLRVQGSGFTSERPGSFFRVQGLGFTSERPSSPCWSSRSSVWPPLCICLPPVASFLRVRSNLRLPVLAADAC